MQLLNILRGYESLGTAFWVTLFVLGGFFAFEYSMVQFSGFYRVHFLWLRPFMLTIALTGVYHCADAVESRTTRLIAKSWAGALFAVAWANATGLFGVTGLLAYPLLAVVFAFLVRGEK